MGSRPRRHAERKERAAQDEVARRRAYELLPDPTVDDLVRHIHREPGAIVDGSTHRTDRIPLRDMAEALHRVHGAVDLAWEITPAPRPSGPGFLPLVVMTAGILVPVALVYLLG